MGQSNFDLVASFYPLLEQLVFGSTLNQAREFFAREIGAGKEILLIGRRERTISVRDDETNRVGFFFHGD